MHLAGAGKHALVLRDAAFGGPQHEGYQAISGVALILRDRGAIVSKDEGVLTECTMAIYMREPPA